ncbi:recombinase family protein [Bosea massiliensis]|uniref:Recombinase family protein n=1 Tax=Bosea massiliensis TaxID=151419 RepID=A0ABW0NZR0_9HYPH
MLVGYARTSTTEQTAGLADQVAELTRLGCERVFEEHGSGVDNERPKLREAIDFVRRGDVLVVTKPDRIARSAIDLLTTVKAVQAKGCEVRILSLGIDTTAPTGKLTLTVLAGMAEFERDLMLERQRAGIAAAKAQGKYKGRAPTARAKASGVAELWHQGMGASEIATKLQISRASVYRILGALTGRSVESLDTVQPPRN